MNVLIILRAKKEESIFPQAQDYIGFLRLLLDVKRRYAEALYGFCLMPDYCKIVARFTDGRRLREFIRDINRGHAERLFIAYAKEDCLRNEAPVIIYPYELLDVIRKIEIEPVHAGLIGSAAQYPFCSAYHRGCQAEILQEVAY